ncbi:MAG: hypothetical protein J1E01_08160 [Acetatifactor sp.]|nr:hypothetical protein [Acetatifactor sp.]
MDFDGLNSLVCESVKSNLWLEVPLSDPSEKDYRLQYIWLWIVVAVICLIFITRLCLLLHSTKTTDARLAAAKSSAAVKHRRLLSDQKNKAWIAGSPGGWHGEEAGRTDRNQKSDRGFL